LRELLIALNTFFISPILFALLIAIVAYVILSWMMPGGPARGRSGYQRGARYNPRTAQFYLVLESILNPMLRPLRRLQPKSWMVDFAPLMLGLIVGFLREYAIPRLISLVPV
jgi:YggT family protein